MKQKKKVFVTVALGVVCAILLFFYFREDDASRIHAALDTMIEIVSKQEVENPVQGMLRVGRLEEYLVATPRMQVRGLRSVSGDRQQLIAAVAAARTRAKTIDVTVSQRRLAIAEDGQRAEMTATASVTLDYNGHPQKESGSLQMEWVKIDGSWRLHSVVAL